VDLPAAPSSIDSYPPSDPTRRYTVKKNSYNYYNGNHRGSPDEANYSETKASMLRRRVTVGKRPPTPPPSAPPPEARKKTFSKYPGRRKRRNSIGDLRGDKKNSSSESTHRTKEEGRSRHRKV
jgi:hypothetical protein